MNIAQSGGGVGLAGFLTILFAILKVTHAVSWSWWLVFAPLLLSWTVFLIFLAAFTFIVLVKLGDWIDNPFA